MGRSHCEFHLDGQVSQEFQKDGNSEGNTCNTLIAEDMRSEMKPIYKSVHLWLLKKSRKASVYTSILHLSSYKRIFPRSKLFIFEYLLICELCIYQQKSL